MKKWMITTSVLTISLALGTQAEAKSNIPMPKLKDAVTIQSMKEGSYSINGVTLGMKRSDAEKQWGKDFEDLPALVKRYNDAAFYSLENSFVEPFYTGERGMKKSDYQFTDINYMYMNSHFTYDQMIKYWGKPDYKYHSANVMNYQYGNTLLRFMDKKHGGEFNLVWYANDDEMKKQIQKFKK